MLTLSRLALSFWLWERVQDAGGLWPILIGGWRIDLCLIAMVIGLPAALSPWFGHRPLAARLTAWWYRIWWMLFVLLEGLRVSAEKRRRDRNSEAVPIASATEVEASGAR